MRLYEYEAKRLFRRAGIPTPDNIVVERDAAVLENVVYPVVLKAQVFLGGRGKAGFVKTAHNAREAQKHIKAMLGKKHGAYRIERILVERMIDIDQEIYVAAAIDRLSHRPLVMTSRHGGMDIEEIAKKEQAIMKFYFNPGQKIHKFMARKIAGQLGFSGQLLAGVAGVIEKVYNLLVSYDCKLVEVNPLVIDKRGSLYAVDAKVDLDEDAMFRHRDLAEMGIVARHEVGELTDRERTAKALGIPYVDLDGDIGVFPGGAGFGIAAIDLIQHYGGKPANFMDSGGAPTQEKLRAMLGLLIDNPRVKAIFGARFGGISRCDDWAKAVVQYVLENKPEKPMIMRMAGNMEAEGRKILEQAKQEHPEFFKDIKIYAVDTPIEEVIKETIRCAGGE
ncbi:MAG: acetate--CoA ligase family protein [candidate division WOR-3 bacterium]|nr:MAG: acetate--CoA ligase family protein [candidate division WOR-3 bacterium]